MNKMCSRRPKGLDRCILSASDSGGISGGISGGNDKEIIVAVMFMSCLESRGWLVKDDSQVVRYRVR